MGEKIRDIRPITLIGNELMVELNEGYTKEQGRVIHIQDPKFRYLLTEKQFYETAGLIMRAAVELTFIKSHYVKGKTVERERNSTTIDSFPMLPVLESSGIDYRILDCREKIVTLLISPDDSKEFDKFAKGNGMRKLEHPFGKRHGYQFLYQMKEFKIYEKQGQYYEVYYQLPCVSLTPKMWMPLDRKIQQSVWESFRSEKSLKYVSNEEYFIYRLVRAIFEKKCFDDQDREYFVSKKEIVKSETLQQKLSVVLFKFAPTILGMIEAEELDSIIDYYYSSKAY